MTGINHTVWQKSNLQDFWSEVAPSEHVVQIYDNDTLLLDSLEGFIGSGLIAGDSVIIIATPEHLLTITDRLKTQGFNMEQLVSTDRFIGLDANETLAKFMVNGWPDEKLFFDLVKSILIRASRPGRKIRAFGEMVALLWQQGHKEATVQLEALWNQLHKRSGFTLFCAYPKKGFGQSQESIDAICCEHHKVIDGSLRPSTEVYYKTTVLPSV